MVTVKVFNESANNEPVYSKDGDTCCDIQASMSHTRANLAAGLGKGWRYDEATSSVIINPGGRALIGTGLFCEIPYGYGIAIRPRSGTALKNGVTVCNTPGAVDSGYRNEIGVILINHSDEDFVISEGDRIAQLSLEQVIKIEWCLVNKRGDLSSSDRDQNGFGSTGK